MQVMNIVRTQILTHVKHMFCVCRIMQMHTVSYLLYRGIFVLVACVDIVAGSLTPWHQGFLD